MNAEMIAALREIENERNISFESLLEALEAALISAYKRNFGGEANAIVTIDRQTGDYQVYHRRVVVADGEGQAFEAKINRIDADGTIVLLVAAFAA